MHWRSKRKAQAPAGFQIKPATTSAPKPLELVENGVYWVRLTDRRLTGTTDWQIARQCFDDRFMVMGTLHILWMEDIAEIGPLILPPCKPFTGESGSQLP